jgi:type IV secretory pathway VirB2 component (pilin)
MTLKKLFVRAGLPTFGLFCHVGQVYAGTGPDMPWDSGLDKIVKNLTGKTALAIGVLAMFAAAAALVFGGEMSEFTRRLILMILAVAVMVSGTSLLNILFGVTGALMVL